MPELNWFIAVVIFGIAMMFFDTHYLMPNYLPKTADGSLAWGTSFWHDQYTPTIFKWLISALKFVFGIPLILLASAGGDISFGGSGLSTAAASAVVFYTLLVPYLIVLSFVIENADGVPPGYRAFQFFITSSGAKTLERSMRARGRPDAVGFARKVDPARSDKYQSRMETEELEATAERLRRDAMQARERSVALSEAEEKRLRAAEEAAQAAEEAFRMKVRERALKEK